MPPMPPASLVDRERIGADGRVVDSRRAQQGGMPVSKGQPGWAEKPKARAARVGQEAQSKGSQGGPWSKCRVLLTMWSRP